MNLSFLTSFFKKETENLQLPDSILVKKLKTITKAHDYLVYSNITIYHHSKSYFIPLLILSKENGIYLFEYKEWTFDELKNAHIQKAPEQSASSDTLAFEKSHTIIVQKFNELTHTDGVPIHNYLLMENLNADEHEHLNDSFKKLLPSHKIMFSDSSHMDILEKLSNVPKTSAKLPSIPNIMGNILIQYTLLEHNSLYMATEEQMDFINSNFNGYNLLYGGTGTGKTSVLTLKVILEKLKNPKIKIVILKATVLSCDILKKKLMEIIEHAIVEIDITTIKILTPLELINQHLSKLKKPLLQNEIHIDSSLMNKKINIADFVICDDSDLFSGEFIAYIKYIQLTKSLLLVSNSNEAEHTFKLQKSFKNNRAKLLFYQTSPHAKALQIISKLLKTENAKDILVVSSSLNKEKLKDDLDSFIKDKAILLDSSKNLIDQDLNNLLLSTYSGINGLEAKFVILLDTCSTTRALAEYAANLSYNETFVLYDNECENINYLKEECENSKNTPGVEEST